MRWHPQIIHWCLHLCLKSSGAYHKLRESGVLKLPSERTLRDYTYCIPPNTGFQGAVAEQLVKDSKLNTLPDSHNFIVITFDEMKIREGLVYDKYTDQLIGFVTLDDVSNHLLQLERSCTSAVPTASPNLATHMLVFVIRGQWRIQEFEKEVSVGGAHTNFIKFLY